jgi:hypothetical protein
MKLVLSVIGLLALFSCGNLPPENRNAPNQPEETAVATTSEFWEICSTLPKVELPYSVYCEDCCVQADTTSQRKMRDFLPEGSAFVGIIEQTDAFVSALLTYPADWIIPAVVVFNREGEKIDEEVFLGGYCGSDYGYMSRQYFYINDARDLMEIDSVFTLTLDPETFKTLDTTKTEIEVKKFEISAKGIEKRG